jgi:hypothetical protein
MQIREGAYFQAFALPSHFWLLLLPFRFKCFLLTSSSFQTKEKKNHREEKNAKKGGNLPLFKQKKRKKKHKERREFTSCQIEGKKKKKTHKEKKIIENRKNVEKVIFSPFCIWDEALLLLFPLQIPSTLNSPPSSSLMSTSP